MPSKEMIDKVAGLADKAAAKHDEYSGIFETVQVFLTDLVGQNGLPLAYGAGTVVALFLLTRIVNLTLSTFKYIAIPIVALSVLATVALVLLSSKE